MIVFIINWIIVTFSPFLFYKGLYFKDYIATIKHVAKFTHARKAEMAITMQWTEKHLLIKFSTCALYRISIFLYTLSIFFCRQKQHFTLFFDTSNILNYYSCIWYIHHNIFQEYIKEGARCMIMNHVIYNWVIFFRWQLNCKYEIWNNWNVCWEFV